MIVVINISYRISWNFGKWQAPKDWNVKGHILCIFFSSSIGLLTKTTEQKWDEEEKKKKELKNV